MAYSEQVVEILPGMERCSLFALAGRNRRIEKLLPSGLELDLWEGKAWVSLVAFTINGMRPRFSPSFPGISSFHEVNLRTYVRSGKKRGIYFLNIEAGKRISSFLARMFLGLPYHFSEIKRRFGYYQVKNNTIHHMPWALETLAIEKLSIDYPRFHSLLSAQPHRIHYSKGVQVLTWGKLKRHLNLSALNE